MSDFRTHTLAGFIVGIAFMFYTRSWWCMLFSVIGSMLPDLDLRNSTSFKWYVVIAIPFLLGAIYIKPVEGLLFTYILKYIALAFVIGLAILQFVQHREIFHSIFAGLIYSAPIYYFFGTMIALSGLFGYYSHLLLDDELFDGVFT